MKKLILVLALFVVSFGYTQETQTQPEPVKSKFESFEQMITPYVKELLDFAKQGAELVVSETPVVIKQYLYFTATKYWLYILLGLAFMTIINRYLRNQWTRFSEEKPESGEKSYIDYKKVGTNRWLRIDTDNDDSVTYNQVLYHVSKYLMMVIGFIVVTSNIVTAIKVTFFPKLFLLEKFIHLVS